MKVTNFEEYVLHSPKEVSRENKEWIDTALSFISTNFPILEIGSGTGRDADYIESKGFKVLRTDIDERFIAYQKEKVKEVSNLDILNDKMKGEYGLVFANAVLHHFDKDTIIQCLHKIKNHTKIIAFNLPNSSQINISEIQSELKLKQLYFQKTKDWSMYVFNKTNKQN